MTFSLQTRFGCSSGFRPTAVAFPLIIALVVTCVSASAIGHHPVRHNITGIAGQSLTMACHHGTGHQLHDVVWSDRVHTSSHDRAVIFRSAGNPSRSIEPSHSNKEFYQVDSDFRLTITRLEDEDLSDVGDYYCDAVGPGGVNHERHYYLAVIKKPECTTPGLTKRTLKPGETVTLVCDMRYGSEAIPTMKWSAGDLPLDSKDDYEPGEAKRTLEIVASVDDDRRPFRCETQMFNTVNTCAVEFTVPHSVRQAQFVGSKRQYRVNEEVRCSAKGSPDPDIVLTPSLGQQQQQQSAATDGAARRTGEASAGSLTGPEQLPALPETAKRNGPGWRSIIVPESWLGRRVSIQCEASNVVDGQRSEVTTRIDFEVIAAAKAVLSSASNDRLLQRNGFVFLLTSFFAVLMSSSQFAVVRRLFC